MINPVDTFAGSGLIPYYDAQSAKEVHGKLPVSVSYVKGTILGELDGNNEVQQLVIDATNGTFTVTFGGQTTAVVDHDATAAILQAALEALSTIGAGNVAVTRPTSEYKLTEAAGTDAGAFALRITRGGNPETTAAVAWNVSTADLTTAIVALANIGAAGVVVSGTAGVDYTLKFLPTLGDVQVEVVNDTTNDGGVAEGGVIVSETLTGSRYLITFQNDLGYANQAAMTTDATLLTGGAGTATVTTITAGGGSTPGTFKKYDPTATDGSQIPKALLAYDCTTNADGLITYGTADTGGEHKQRHLSAPVFIYGYFRTTDIPDLTAAAAAQLGKMIHGHVGDGVILIGV